MYFHWFVAIEVLAIIFHGTSDSMCQDGVDFAQLVNIWKYIHALNCAEKSSELGTIYQPKYHVYDSNWNIFLVINEAHRNKHGYIQKMSMENVDIHVVLLSSNNILFVIVQTIKRRSLCFTKNDVKTKEK